MGYQRLVAEAVVGADAVLGDVQTFGLFFVADAPAQDGLDDQGQDQGEDEGTAP